MSNRFFAFVHHDHPKLMQIVEAPTSHAARMRLSKELPGPVSYRLSFDTVDQARNHADNLGLGVEIRFVAKEWKGSANNKLVWYGFRELSVENASVRWFMQASSLNEAKRGLLKLRVGNYEYVDDFYDIENARDHCARNGLHPLFYPNCYTQSPTENKFFRFFGARNDTWYYVEAPTADQASMRIAAYAAANNEAIPRMSNISPHDNAIEAEREAKHFEMKAIFLPHQRITHTKDFRLALNNEQISKLNPEQRALIDALFPKPFTWAARRVALKNALEETFWILFGVLGVSVMVCCLTLVFWTVYMLLSGGFAR